MTKFWSSIQNSNRDSGSGKANSLFKLINPQPDIDEMHLYPKDPYKVIFNQQMRK